MPNRPQDPPEGSYSLHMAPGICRPTSPPPPIKKTTEAPMIASAFKRVCDLQEQLKYVNSMLLASWERERRIQSEYEKVMAKLGKHECPNCGETEQENIVDSDPGETGDTTRYCNLCSFSWPDLHPIRKEKNKCHGCNGAGGEWFDSCSFCGGSGKSTHQHVKPSPELPANPDGSG